MHKHEQQTIIVTRKNILVIFNISKVFQSFLRFRGILVIFRFRGCFDHFIGLGGNFGHFLDFRGILVIFLVLWGILVIFWF